MKLLAKITAALTLAVALTLTACAPGGETGTTNPPSSVFASKTALPAGDPNCANGGVQIDMGFDVNGNNVLDADEITSTEYVCNGTDTSSHPFVVYTSPTPNETGVELDAVISVVFNIEMDADTINDTTFTVKDAAGNPVAGTVTCSGIVAVFQPDQSLVMNTKYTVTLSSAMQNDAAGIAMGYDHKFYFTSGASAVETGFNTAVNPGDTATITTGPLTVNMKYANNSDTAVTFPMGTNDQSTGTITRKFFMAETEVTNALFARVLQWAVDNGKIVEIPGVHNEVSITTVKYGTQKLVDLDYGSTYVRISYNADTNTFAVASGYEDHPVVCVSWYGTIMFCNWLTEMCEGNIDNVVYSGIDETWDHTEIVENPERTGYRLPSSAEWEYAARYRNGTLWTYGDHASGDESGACYNDGSILGGMRLSAVFGNYAWWDGNSGSSTNVVSTAGNGGGAACTGNSNALGLYDMSGNVWEWNFDCVGSDRVVRGGNCWTSAGGVQVGVWDYYNPNDESSDAGFRFARSAP